MIATATVFLAMMIPLIWSPGPNNVMCATVGAKQGVKRAVPFILGLNLPIFIYALLTGVGLSAVLSRIPQITSVLTLLGALYVVYLGVKLIKSTAEVSANNVQYGSKSGFVISSLNFKVITVLVVMYSQFTTESFVYSSLLAVCFVLVCITGHLLWSLLGRASSQLIKSGQFVRLQNLFYGLMLIGVGAWMLTSTLIPMMRS